MTTGSPAASRTCRRPMWKFSAGLSVRPKNGGTPGSAASARSRSARAAPRRSDAQASTPASVTALAAVRISVRQSAARARWARSAVSTGSGTVVSGAADGDTVGGRYAPPRRRRLPFRRRSCQVAVRRAVSAPFADGHVSPSGLDDGDVDGAELPRRLQQHGLGRLADVERRLPAQRGQRAQPRVGEHLVDQAPVTAGEQRDHLGGVRQQHPRRGLGRMRRRRRRSGARGAGRTAAATTRRPPSAPGPAGRRPSRPPARRPSNTPPPTGRGAPAARRPGAARRGRGEEASSGGPASSRTARAARPPCCRRR